MLSKRLRHLANRERVATERETARAPAQQYRGGNMATSQDHHPLRFLLRQLELYCELPDEDRTLVLDLPHRVRRLDAGSYLVREGDMPTTCMVLAIGYAYR